MSSYQITIRSIATEALNGEDVQGRISHLAMMLRLDARNISQEVDEMIDLLK